MSKDWWESKRRRPYFWFDIFEEFETIEGMMKMTQKAVKTTPKRGLLAKGSSWSS